MNEDVRARKDALENLNPQENIKKDSNRYLAEKVWKKNNKPPLFELIGSKTTSFRVFALKMDLKFVLKVKPKKKPCTPQQRAKQYPRKFHADKQSPILFNLWCCWEHQWKSVLDKHLSAVHHIKRMDESSSRRAKQQTLKTSFKCKTPAHEEI